MAKFIKSFIIVILIFLILGSIFVVISSQIEKIDKVSFSTLVSQINEDKIEKITINENNLEIELKDGNKEKTTKESGISLSEALINYGVEKEKLKTLNVENKNQSGWQFWLSILVPTILPFIFIIVFFWLVMKQAQRGSMQAFTFTKSGARMISPNDKKNKTTFNDVAGLKEAKEELMEIVDFLKNPKKFILIGAKIPRGVLLMGPSGTGKTLLARAVAGEANVPFFYISASEFVEMFVGVGASRIRDLFKDAKKEAPSIIFIDEIDAVGRHRGAGLGGGHDEREQTLNQLLVEMDGFDNETGIIVIAATNRPDILDPALLRPGRFDRRIVLDEPDINDREAILKIHVKNKPLGKDINLREIAERTPGFSGADLANIANEAAILSARHNKKEINQKELIDAIEKVLLGPERKSRILSPKEKQIAAYHEAGHALVTASLPGADLVRKISIISRGIAAGYTLKLPTEDKHFKSQKEFEQELAISLGGYMAEKIVFNELTTGASNDLEQATDLARKMVMKFGMSSLGPITFGKTEELIFLGKEIAQEKNYSEEVAAKLDKEIEKLIKKAAKTAEKILKEKRPILEKITARLIEKETIEKEEFEQIIKENTDKKNTKTK